jgi:raffinose/stachyose/melibiose transport system permease protein
MLTPLGLIDTYWSVILPEVGLSIAFGTYWLRSSFAAVPKELVEAARVDGASSWQVLVRVLLPVTRASILTLGTLFFMWSWNEFLLALVFLQTQDKVTAPAGLASFLGTYSSDIPGLCASALIVMAPVLVAYLLTQRTFVRGLFEGAAK